MEFKGVSPENTEIYLIDYKVHEEDTMYPLSGQRGSLVFSLLGSMSCLDKVRVANWLGQGSKEVMEDILNCRPKVIVGFGAELMNLFLGETSKKITDASGTINSITLGDLDTIYIPVMSPSYVLNRINDGEVSLKFSQDLYKAFQVCIGEIRDITKDKEILSAHSYEEFVEIYNSHYLNNSKVAYDIETTARPIFMEGSDIIGFSIGNENSGVYVSLKSLDFNMDDDEIEKIWDFTKNEIFDKKDKLIIHNTMYERPYTLYCQGYEIKFDKAEDTLVMARLLKGAKESAGLKYQAQKYLHYPDWETDLNKYISGFKSVVSRIGQGPKKFSKLWNEIYNGLNLFEVEFSDVFENLSESDQLEVSGMINQMKLPVEDLYDKNDVEDIGRLITDKIVEVVDKGGIQDSTIPYNWIPDKVLSKYGAIDSISTYELYDYFLDVMDKESTDKVDLHKGYQNWLEHMYVAYIMERNGFCWNEDLVVKDEEFLTAQATECLKGLLKSPLFVPFIEESGNWKYKPLILSDYLPQIAESQGYHVNYDKVTEKYTVYFNNKRVSKGKIDDIQISNNFKNEYNQIIVQLFNEEVDNAKHYDDLKDLFNPSSVNASETVRKILMTDTLQMGGRINELHVLSVSPEFEDVKDKIPVLDQKFLVIADTLFDADSLKSKYGKDWASYRKQFYEGFCNLYDMYKKKMIPVQTKEISEILDRKLPVVIDSFDDGGTITLYNNYVVTGIDQDDRSTWTPEFEWLINYRLFKKSQKLVSSYINGTIGRQSVVIVDKNKLTNGDTDLSRKRYYSEGKANENEGYLLAAKWSPNTAETGRWRSGFHTIPWGSQVKKYYTSRFKGGTICCPDYSQMEVRTLAAISHDENMLELFRSGKDFHTETAKKVWQKDEVTTAERRFSKTATFSLLYGAMESSFARNYCKGDMAMAEKIYGGFFKAYPGVKKWVDEMHEEVQKSHRVSLELSNRFIPIEPDGDGAGALASMLRKAQNYPIQAQSADLTGCVVYDLQKYIEEQKMKSLIFMYVHDSIEVDVYPYEMIKFINEMSIILNKSPMDRMGLPSKAEVTLGKSLGHEIEMKSIEHNDEFTECTLVLEGYQDEIYETVDTWKEAYKTVEILEEEWEEEFVSMSELFILRKAFTPTLGTLRHKGTAKVHLSYYT